MTAVVAPVRVEARLDPQLSRWLWLVKWLLAVPHYVCLAVLWAAFVLTSVVALVAILATGRYPRGLFAFNAGVLRWSWRVGYYAYGALGTDRYPPFTLGDAPDYPARLEIAYPEHLSRGLVLVKWWLLALPHYLVLGVLLGGGAWASGRDDEVGGPASLGLIGLLVVIAAVALTVTGRYPRGLFDLVLGLDRWVLRVAAYAGLLTDQYPPFRLDLGGSEPQSLVVSEERGPEDQAPAPAPGVRSAGRIVAGSLVLLLGLPLLAAGAGTAWLDRVGRDDDGFLTTDLVRVASSAPAVVSERLDVHLDETAWALSDDLLGEVRLRAEATDGGAVFVGIAASADVERYLEGVAQDRAVRVEDRAVVLERSGGASAADPPTEQRFWAASASGTGRQTVDWEATDGRWTAVVMRPEGTAGVDVRAEAGATVPVLQWVAVALLVSGAVLSLAGGALLASGAGSRTVREA